MNDGSFTTSITAADLSPAQRSQLDARLAAEGIPVSWLGGTLQFDQAFEARIETLVTEVRSAPGPAPAGAPAPGFVPTVTAPVGSAPPGYPQPGYPPAGYPPPPYPAAGYYPARVTNSNATISLVLGLLAWMVCPLTAIFGVIYGRRAQDEIDASGGTQSGEGMAKAGIILSWIIIGIYGLMIVGFIVFLILFGIIGVAASTT
jgi:hypothetical protein